MKRFLGAAALLLIASVPAAHAAEGWSRKMQDLRKVLEEILLDTSSDQRFGAKENFKRIESNAKKLADLAHDIDLREVTPPDADPSLRIIGKVFADESAHAYRTLKAGHRQYARGVLRSMPGYCIACHTRNSSGPRFDSIGTAPEKLGLKGIDKAAFLTSTRQFDKALAEYEAVLSDTKSYAGRSIEWERAVRSGLSIAVRVKKDPVAALRIVDLALASPVAPAFLKEDAQQWKEGIEAWKAEKPREATSQEGLHAEALRLLAEARKRQQYPADRGADVWYLRANGAVHDLLATNPPGEKMSEALYLAGVTYEVLQDVSLWDLHEFYYLSCIYRTPNSAIAQRCYRAYEQSLYLGYTGSAGTDLPEDARQKLRELEQLSNPANKKIDKLK